MHQLLAQEWFLIRAVFFFGIVTLTSISSNRWGLEHDIPKGQSQLSRQRGWWRDEGLSHNHSLSCDG